MKTRLFNVFIILFLSVFSLFSALGLIKSPNERVLAQTARELAAQTTGGPDSFGYRYWDSLDGSHVVTYTWSDISAGGTPLAFSGNKAAVALPQPFSFYGTVYNTLYVTTNGYAAFEDPATIVTQCIPANRQPAPAPAAFCTELNIGSGAYYSQTIYNNHPALVVQYSGVTHTVTGLTATFQMILDFQEQAIIYQYQALPTGPVTATAGIIGKATNQTDYLIYCQGASGCPAQTGLAVKFAVPAAPELHVAMSADTLAPEAGEQVVYTLALSNSGPITANGAILTNTLPAGLDYVTGTLQATGGAASYQTATGTIGWMGNLANGAPVTLTYAILHNTTDFIYNTAYLSHPLARDIAGATSTPVDAWSEPQPLDLPHSLYGNLGSARFIAVDADNLPKIAYGSSSMFYAALSSTTWLSQTVSGSSAGKAALTVDTAGRSVAAFLQNTRIQVARQITNTNNSAWVVDTIAELGNNWLFGSLELQAGADGSLHLAYSYADDIYYTVYSDTTWLAPVKIIPLTNCQTNNGFSLALNSAGTPAVGCVYRNVSDYELRLYAYSATAPWTTYQTVAANTGTSYTGVSLAYAADTPHLSYFSGGSLYHAVNTGSWQIETVDSAPATNALQTVIATGGDNLAISYGAYSTSYPYETTLKAARKPLTGGAWEVQSAAVFTSAQTPDAPTLALDSLGNVHLAYYYPPESRLHYALWNSQLTTTVVDKSRQINGASVAVGSNGATHIAYLSEGLRYLTAASDTITVTRTFIDPANAGGAKSTAITVDPAQTPHIIYSPGNGVVYHATLNGSAWITRPVDTRGNLAGLAIDSGATGTAHAAYLAETGGNYVVRHAAWNGTSWLTETLATAGPAHFTHNQTPQVAVSAGKTYVLYADCTAFVDFNYPIKNYPVSLMLKTWDGSTWATQTLYQFTGQCASGQLAYHLLNDHAGQVSAVAEIYSTDVRPNPLGLVYAIAGQSAGRQMAVNALPQPEEISRISANNTITDTNAKGIESVGGWYNFRGYGLERLQFNYEEHSRQVAYLKGRFSTPVTQTGSLPSDSADLAGSARYNTAAGLLTYTYGPYGLYREYPTRYEITPVKKCCANIAVSPAGSGSINPRSGFVESCNTTISFSALPSDISKWVFKNWSGDVNGTNSEATLLLTKQTPTCHEVTANFVPVSTAGANKTATTISTTVYPQQVINYQVQLNWGSDHKQAAVKVVDTYPDPRVSVISGSISAGPYLTCNHNAGLHSIGCTGDFPMQRNVSSFLKFNALATCDIYATQPDQAIINRAAVDIDSFKFSPQAVTAPTVPFELSASSPGFIPASAFDGGLFGGATPKSTVLLYTTPITGAPNCCTNCALDVYVVADGDVNNPLKMENNGLVSPAGADLISGDCHHSLWFNPTEDRPYIFDLYVVKQGDPFAAAYKAPQSLTLNPQKHPGVVSVTDLRELFNEFNRTQPNSAQNDSNNNCIKDYYESVARLFEYAKKHQGVVLDVRQSMYDLTWDYTNNTARALMYPAIDLLIAKLPLYANDQYPDNIAIIGDDAVVPFYRVPNLEPASCQNAGCNEATYTDTTTWSSTPAGTDTANNLVLSDVPYANEPVTLPVAPQSTYAVGRVFASAPLTLTQIISGYEQPVVIGPAKTSAYVFNIANEYDYDSQGNLYISFDWQDNTLGSAIKPLQNSGYLTVTRSLTQTNPYYYGWIDGELGIQWHSRNVIGILRAVKGNRLTILNSHASHLLQTTEDPNDTDELPGTDFDILQPYPGAVLVSFGCHAGYSTGFDQTDYRNMLVRGVMERNLTYHASTTYGASTADINSRFHDLIHQQFLLMLHSNAATVGEARRLAVNRYQTFYTNTTTYSSGDKVAQYGTVLYGLPTQPINTPVISPTVRRSESARQLTGAATAGAITVTFNVSAFSAITQTDGSTRFEVAGGVTTSQGDGPVVPLLIQSVTLPQNAANLIVTMVSTAGQVYTEAVQLPLQQVGNRTLGVQPVPYNGATPYPNPQFWTTVFTDAGQTAIYISAIPLMYNPQTDQAVLLTQMQFRVEYTQPAAGVALTDVTVNNNRPVLAAQPVLPVTANVEVAEDQPLTLHWLLEDYSASPRGAGSAEINAATGGNQISWDAAVSGLTPGNYILHLRLTDADGLTVATYNYPITVQGTLSPDNGVYLPVVLK